MGAADAVQSTVLDGILGMFREFEEWCPGVVGHVLEFFVDIPEAKELRLYDLADEYGKLAQQLSDHLERISPSFTAIAENWSGSIGAEQFFQSMQQHMDEVGSSIKAAGSMQEMVQQNAQNIETMKFMAAMDLVMLAWTIYTLIMAAIATFGIAAVGAGPAIAACGAAIKSAGEKLLAQLAKDGVEAVLPATLKKAAEKAAEGVAERAAKKAAEIAAEQAAKKAAEEAAAQVAEQVGTKGIGQVLAAPFRSMAGRMAATRAAEQAGGKVARKALVQETRRPAGGQEPGQDGRRRETAVAAKAAEEAALKKFADAGFKDVAGELGSAALRRGEQFALFTFGTEGGVQAWQVTTGHRSGFDLSELALHTATGFLTGVVGTPLTLGRAGMAAEVSAMVGGTLAVDAATHPLNNYLAEHSLFGMSPEDKTSWGEWWSQEQGNLAKAASYGAMGGANHLRGELDRHLALVQRRSPTGARTGHCRHQRRTAIRGLVTFPDSAPAGLDIGAHGTTDIGTPSDVPAGARGGGAAATGPAASRDGSGSTATADPGTRRDVPSEGNADTPPGSGPNGHAAPVDVSSHAGGSPRADLTVPPDRTSHAADTAPSPNGVTDHRASDSGAVRGPSTRPRHRITVRRPIRPRATRPRASPPITRRWNPPSLPRNRCAPCRSRPGFPTRSARRRRNRVRSTRPASAAGPTRCARRARRSRLGCRSGLLPTWAVLIALVRAAPSNGRRCTIVRQTPSGWPTKRRNGWTPPGRSTADPLEITVLGQRPMLATGVRAMAISVFFRLIRQDETELEYEFGDRPTQTERRLVIDLTTMRARPTDGREDYHFAATARRISVLLGQKGTWPEQGGVQN